MRKLHTILLVSSLVLPVVTGAQAIYDKNRAQEPGAKTWLAAKAKLPPFKPPRTADGRPDLQGRWGGSASGDDVEEVATAIDITTPAAESWVAEPSDGKLPYQPWALAERDAHRRGLARGWPGEDGSRLYADPQTFCLASVPRYAQRGFDLVQQRNQVVQMLDWGHVWRVIPLDGRPHPAAAAKFWMGNARGRWDGDTLVVEVTNLNAKMWLDSVGNFYGENARVTERFRLVEANTIDYEVTIDDPAVFTRRAVLDYPLRRAGTGGGCAECRTAAAAPGEVDPYEKESWEHACHEGNSQHIDGVKGLGFKWYLPPTSPRP